jgi:hypothetical protein
MMKCCGWACKKKKGTLSYLKLNSAKSQVRERRKKNSGMLCVYDA